MEKEIRAEVLLNYLYPELDSRWRPHFVGSFYRNYNQDIIFLNEETGDLDLTRNGLIDLLPQGVYATEPGLRGKDSTAKLKKIERRVKLMREALLPFDIYWFKENLQVERQISALLEEKLAYVLNAYFGFDLEQETNPLVREAAVILPFVCSKRGDFGFVRMLLSALMHCEVTMEIGRFSHTDNTVRWLPMISYELLDPGLTPEQYCEKDALLSPLREFITEWFIPMEVKCKIQIKEHQASQRVGTRLTLGYNTELKQSIDD